MIETYKLLSGKYDSHVTYGCHVALLKYHYIYQVIITRDEIAVYYW